jgi:hypothetical protein
MRNCTSCHRSSSLPLSYCSYPSVHKDLQFFCQCNSVISVFEANIAAEDATCVSNRTLTLIEREDDTRS